jgi:flagellin-like protein
MKKKGVSPVIATVLLIVIVLILAVIIFLWAKSFVGERAEKFGSAIELSCDKTNFEVGLYSSPNTLEILNKGTVPLYGFVLKLQGDAEVKITARVEDATIRSGESKSFELEDTPLNIGDNYLVIPIILGETDTDKVPYTCGDQYHIATSVV